MLGGVLGRYIQWGVTFKGALLFSVYGIALNCTDLIRRIPKNDLITPSMKGKGLSLG